MKQFNTHGGYFAPLGYTRVNEGGSHDENPYGGVQVGVDENGVPDMVQEDESIYDDFVFSNTIKADKKFLKDNKIPEKYAGKLYSEIVDSLMKEAEERPLDAVSNNGLRVMLSRLANSQESQKKFNEEKEIEKELESLSPEELAQLEQMLAAESQAEMQGGIQPAMRQSMTMAACGGKIRKHDDGGIVPVRDNTGVKNPLYGQSTGLVPLAVPDSSRDIRFDDGPLGWLPIAGDALSGAQVLSDLSDEKYLDAGIGAALLAVPNFFEKPAKAALKYVKKFVPTKKVKALLDDAAKESAKNAKSWINSKWTYLSPTGLATMKWRPTTTGGKIAKGASIIVGDTGLGMGLARAVPWISENYVVNPFEGLDQDPTIQYQFDYSVPSDMNFSCGGKMNRYDIGGGFGIKRNEVPDLLNYKAPKSNIDFSEMVKIGIIPTPETVHAIAEPVYNKFESQNNKLGSQKSVNQNTGTDNALRMAPVISSAIKGLYNAFQGPDTYSVKQYRPTLPTGELHLTDPTFVPIDTSMLVNNALAGHAATIRALRNSGNMISAPMSIIAADNGLYENIGMAQSNAMMTNNQMRNSVIGQRNANAKALADFNLGLSRERSQILNDAAQRNIQNDLLQQRLNYASEGEKYAAIGNEMEKVASGLAGIGTEDIRMNAANGMFDYVRLPDGRTAYAPKMNSNKCGGTLLRKCK